MAEAFPGGGVCSDCAAPCVASFPLLVTSTTGAVGLWELPGLSLQRHDNMQDCPQSQLGLLSKEVGLSYRHKTAELTLTETKISVIERRGEKYNARHTDARPEPDQRLVPLQLLLPSVINTSVALALSRASLESITVVIDYDYD